MDTDLPRRWLRTILSRLGPKDRTNTPYPAEELAIAIINRRKVRPNVPGHPKLLTTRGEIIRITGKHTAVVGRPQQMPQLSCRFKSHHVLSQLKPGDQITITAYIHPRPAAAYAKLTDACIIDSSPGKSAKAQKRPLPRVVTVQGTEPAR